MLQAQVYIDTDEMRGQEPLHEFIVRFLLAQGIAGATAFRGQIGFGTSHLLKRPDAMFSFDEPPMMITFIDEEAKVRSALTELRRLVKSGFIVVAHVEKW